MKTHGVACVWLLVYIFTLFRRSGCSVGNLLELAKNFRQSFTPGKGWIWSPDDNGYLTCQNQHWLITGEKLNTTNVEEVLVEVQYNAKDTVTKQLLNKTELSIGVFNGASNKTFTAAGGKFDGSRNLKATKLLPVDANEARFGIKPLDDQNCLLLYSVKIMYFYCQNFTFKNLAQFPRTNSPRNGSLAVKVEGRCKFNKKTPIAYCESSGNWSSNNTIPCDCGPGRIATDSGCVELSNLVYDIKAIRVSNTKAILLWRSQGRVFYHVICRKCREDNCNHNCSKFKFSSKNNSQTYEGNISGLEEQGNYMLTIIPSMVDSNVSGGGKNVQLNELPSKVRNIKFKTHAPDGIVLFWSPPVNWRRINVSYHVTCEVSCSSGNCSQECEKLRFIPSDGNFSQTNVTIFGFGQEGNQYIFKVFSKTRWFSDERLVQWNFNSINFTEETKENIPTGNTKKFNIVDVIIGVSVLILVVIIAVVVTKCYNRWRARKHSLNLDAESLDNPHNCEVPLTTTSPAHYVDPFNYESVDHLLRQFTKKLNEKNLRTEDKIGEGEFGVVWKGYLDDHGKKSVVVAVKCLRDGLSPKLRRDFLAEASVMGQFKDPNIISLHGVVVRKNTVKIVMEYMSNGSLDAYLVKNSGRLTTLQLLGMARGIASGMQYLSGRNFIHRDLAARNILVDENLCCKVSDFGLTREICKTSNYETRGGKIPIRWTAPEVIKYKKSFIASDVWSFGIVLWEIMSFGQRPYWDWDNFQVLQEIESGYRLPAPLKCPKTVHYLMLDCWQRERTERPQFASIVEKLDGWIRSPETVNNSPTTVLKSSKKVEDLDSECSIEQWLDSIKMGKYASNFREAGYTELNQVANLTEEDLLDMGIKLVGHRHKIHQSIPLVTKALGKL